MNIPLGASHGNVPESERLHSPANCSIKPRQSESVAQLFLLRVLYGYNWYLSLFAVFTNRGMVFITLGRFHSTWPGGGYSSCHLSKRLYIRARSTISGDQLCIGFRSLQEHPNSRVMYHLARIIVRHREL